MIISFATKRLLAKSLQKTTENSLADLDDEFLKLFIIISRSRELVSRFEQDTFVNLEFPDIQLVRALEVAETVIERLELKLNEVIGVVGQQRTSNMTHAAPALRAKIALPGSVGNWLRSKGWIEDTLDLKLTLDQSSVILEKIFGLFSQVNSNPPLEDNEQINAELSEDRSDNLMHGKNHTSGRQQLIN